MEAVIKAYVGVTDDKWFQFLAARPEQREVNFWKPGGQSQFQVLKSGDPFIFKTHWPKNCLVGGGFYEGFVRMTISEAWDIFGEGNGVSSIDEMRKQIGKYRDQPIGRLENPEIGCVLLNEVKFVKQDLVIPAPSDFNKNIVQGKSYDLGIPHGNSVIDMFVRNHMIAVDLNETREPRGVDGPVFGNPRMVKQRLGQGGFKALVRDAYDHKCSITGNKIAPALQAAHIVPISANGENRIDNGVLLRSDVHAMYDRGYLGISPDFRLQVSSRLRTDFGNGEEFYNRQDNYILLPNRKLDQPNPQFLKWHMDTVFIT